MKKVIPNDAVLIPDRAVKKFQGIIYDVYQWQQELFDKSKATFEMLRRPDTVQVICIVEDKIIILKDEQPHNGMRLSLPGGRVDKEDNDIISAAKRECLEETGYEFNSWRLIKVWQPHTKIEWFIHLYLAWDVGSSSSTNHDAGEKIIVEKMLFEDVKKLVLEKAGYLGEVEDVFGKVSSLESLQSLPEFSGKTIGQD